MTSDAVGGHLERRILELEGELACSRKALAGLAENEAKFRALFDHAQDGIYVHDDEGRILDVNRLACEQSGYTRDELLHLTVFDLHVTPPGSARLLEEWKRRTTRRVFNVEAEQRRKDGTLFPVEVWGSVVHEQDRSFRLAVVRDISIRKQAIDKLRKSEERFRGLVETTSDWMWEVDQDGVYTYASPKVEEFLGYVPDEVIGKTPFDFMPPDASAEAVALFTELTKDHQPFSALENLNRHKDGRLVMLETSAVPLFDRDGRFLGYRGIDRDITRRKRTEVALAEERERLRKALDEVKTLRGILPICANCKKIRDDKGYWNQLESYIHDHSQAEFTHGICPECFNKLSREIDAEADPPTRP